MSRVNKSFTLIHQNIQGSTSKKLEIELCLEKLQYDVVCLTEHWQKGYELDTWAYENYCLASWYCRESAGHGGSLILIRNNLQFKQRNDIELMSKEEVMELSCIELDNHIIVSVYRPPKVQNFNMFESLMEDVLTVVFRAKKNIIVCGDFNVNILESKNRLCSKLLSLFKSFNLKNIFCEPTRVTSTTSTCLDNVFVNCEILAQKIVHFMRSDHTGQEIVLPYGKNCIAEMEIVTRPITNHRLQQFNDNLLQKLAQENNTTFKGTCNDLYSNVFSTLLVEFQKKFPLKTITIKNKFKFSDWASLRQTVLKSIQKSVFGG